MFQWGRQGVLFVVFAVLAAGCTTMNSGSSSQGLLFRGNEALQARDLVPGAGIEVSVEVDGIMEVASHRAELNHQGIVTLPLVGDVKIGNMKPEAARSVIAETYGAYYVNSPVVMLSVVDDDAVGKWGFVTVLGRVNEPGRVPLAAQDGINLSAAIQLAGGFAASAKQSDIRVSRIDELGMKIQVSVDFNQIGQSGNADDDILLVAGDIVYIPERIF
ncbi:MAG: SLBB domain-containing protein [Verrucomicrobiota bacterium]